MQSNKFRYWLPPTAGFALVACALCAQAATGVRTVLQVWDPRTPDAANVAVLLDNPTLVSDSLQEAWMRLRPRICEQLRLKMGEGGAAHGETLRDITCLLDEQVVLGVEPTGQNALRARFAVSGYVEATSTTPPVALGVGLDREADPRFSIALTANFDLILVIQSDRAQTLRVSRAQFTLTNATLDSHNVSADMLDFVVGDLVPFFGGPDYKRMAEDAVNAVAIDVASDFNGALAPVNAQLAGPSDRVRIGVSGSGNYISAAFAAREIAPPTNGRMSGMIRWDPAQFMPRDECRSFDVRATVQTGPIPLYTPNASAPTREVGAFQASPVDAVSCAFTMTGLAAGWPNVLTARVVGSNAAKSAGSSLYRVTIKLSGDGWNGRIVVPQPIADARDYRVAVSLEATANEDPGRAVQKRGYRTDAVINPGDSYPQRTNAASRTLPPLASDRASPEVNAVSLNPQPLPPQDQSVQTQAVRKVAGKQPLKSTTEPAQPQR